MKYINSYKIFENINQKDFVKEILVSDLEDFEKDMSLSNKEGFHFSDTQFSEYSYSLIIPIQGRIFYDPFSLDQYRKLKFNPIEESEVKYRYDKIYNLLDSKMPILEEEVSEFKFVYYFKDIITFSSKEFLDFQNLKEKTIKTIMDRKSRNNPVLDSGMFVHEDIMRYYETFIIEFKFK
jgi:hypothetical protein